VGLGRAGSGAVVTVVYDNNSFDPRLKTEWGFSCLVEGPFSPHRGWEIVRHLTGLVSGQFWAVRSIAVRGEREE